MPNRTDTENKAILELQRLKNYGELVRIDNSLQCYNENERCVEATVEEIAAKQQQISDDQETDKVDTPEHQGVSN
jgi:hypothetical protein